jgi:hypothetical protein
MKIEPRLPSDPRPKSRASGALGLNPERPAREEKARIDKSQDRDSECRAATDNNKALRRASDLPPDEETGFTHNN